MISAETIIRNFDGMSTSRCELNRLLEEVSAFACPEKCTDFFGSTDQTEGREKPRHIVIDNVAEANSIFARGLYANLCPPGTQYFQFSPMDKSLQELQEARAWFAAASVRFFEMLGASNYSVETGEAFEDLGWAGILNVAVEADPDAVFRFRNYHISEYYVAEDGRKVIDQVYRSFRESARNIADKYNLPGDSIPEEIRKNAESANIADYDKKYTLIHAVFPNRDYKITDQGEPMLGNENKPWKSVTVCKETKSIIRDSGFDFLPYTVARFEKKAKSIYGYSPGLRILRTAKILNSAMHTLMKFGQKQVDPPVALDMASYKGTPPMWFDHPGALNPYDSTTGGRPPQAIAPVGSPVVTAELIAKWEQAISSAYFVNLFNMIQQLAENTRNDRTKFEIMQLVNEKQTLIIPIVAHIIDEFFQPLFLKAFHIALAAGAFGPLPDFMRMHGVPAVKVAFNSPLALAAKLSQVRVIFDTVQQVGALAELDGGAALDLLEFDEIGRFLVECGGLDPRFIASAVKVKQKREARAQQQQAMLQQQQLGEIAKSQNLNQRPEEGSIAGSAVEALAGGGR